MWTVFHMHPNNVPSAKNSPKIDYYSEIAGALRLAQEYLEKLDILSSEVDFKREIEVLKINLQKDLRFDKLKNISVEELKQHSSGLRINALINAGYDSLYQLRYMNIQDYLAIPGVGQKSAERIIGAYNEIIDSIDDERLDLIDPCTNSVMKEIIIVCYKHFYLSSLRAKYIDSINHLKSTIQRNYNELSKISSPLKWFSTISKKKRKSVYQCVKNIEAILNSNNQEVICHLFEIRSNIQSIPFEVAYKDFSQRRTSYNAFLTSGTTESCSLPCTEKDFLDTSVPQVDSNIKYPSHSWGAISILAILLLLISMGIYQEVSIYKSNSEIYNNAQALLDANSYSLAITEFEKVPNFKDSTALSTYCKYANIYYNDLTLDLRSSISDLHQINLKYSLQYEDDIENLLNHIITLKRKQDHEKEENEKQKEEQQFQIQAMKYSEKYPALYMSEKFITYTKLGKPSTIEKCSGFDHFVPRARYKIYTWGSPDDRSTYFEVTVRYRRHWSNRFDDYTDYPDGEGYVTSILYYDSSGMCQHEDISDLHKKGIYK